jgi:hypothetical protein
MPTRSNYWSCSRFADWLRGTPKLGAGTRQQWRAWRKAAKETHPIRFWIVEEGLDYLQNFVNWPTDRLNDVRYYINNRWVIRSHALTAHARDIRPGTWCDVGNRFLFCLFNELVDFVEVEQAWHHCIWDEEARKRYQVPWWQKNWFTRWGERWRCAEAGVSHLKWAANLKIDQHMGADPGDAEYGQPTHQALAAREILELYMWWKEVRPNRPDPYDASGWTAYCERRRDGRDFFDFDDKTEEEAEQGRVSSERLHEIEAEYEQEDTDMLIRLVRVRDHLWT